MVNWMSFRSIITMSILRELHTKPVDFVLAYTQANVKSDVFMELPIWFGFEGNHPREWVIILDINLYIIKYSGMAWFEKLKEGLEDRGSVQSQVDPCVRYKDEMVLIFDVHDFLMFSPFKDKIDDVYASIQEYFKIEND